ncbi:FecR family protein [Paracandidimonas soli]|uniref:FecR family protein n=2 Tax=Paracandidimonas soli TaxID=1917182 RepID=A0A4R3UV93_9BURK|nr:FecR family protein [Paracandidimonas soli]
MPDLAQLRAQAQARADKRRGRKRLAGGLGALAVAALLWQDPAYRTETWTTARGEQQRLSLRDGSALMLDSGSEIRVSWHLRSRRAQLRQGRAFFDVAKAVYRPFAVQAGSAQVDVVGTAFDIGRMGEDVSVRLYRGAVDVSLPVETPANVRTYRLEPGMAIDVASGKILRRQGLAEGIPDWAQGQLVFERQTLAQALVAIRRYRPETIVLEDPSLAELRVSGVFQIARLDQLFDLLPQIWPVQVRRDGDAIHIGKAGG